MPPPLAERHPGLSGKAPLERAHAEAEAPRDRRCAFIVRTVRAVLGDPAQTYAGRHREPQGRHGARTKRIDDEQSKRLLQRLAPVEHADLARAQDQLSQQRRHGDDAALRPQIVPIGRAQIERRERRRTVERDRVTYRRRRPNRPCWRHDPNALVGAHRHDPRRRVDQLMPIMRVRFDRVPIGQDRAHGADREIGLIGRAVTLSRHRSTE